MSGDAGVRVLFATDGSPGAGVACVGGTLVRIPSGTRASDEGRSLFLSQVRMTGLIFNN